MRETHLRLHGKRVFAMDSPARPAYLIQGDKVIDANRSTKQCFKIRGDKIIQPPATITHKIRMNKWVSIQTGEIEYQMR